jgi:hypothetical protein
VTLPAADPKASKAVAEIAKATPSVVKLVSDLGGLLDRRFGTVLSGIVSARGGDRVHYLHNRNEIRFAAKLVEELAKVSNERRTEPSLSVILPIVEAARDESREEIQDLWVALLANAMLDGGR